MKIGLYFGTFNPIHIGHLIIANYFVENSDLEEVWMVVTPHNPFKKKNSLLDNHHRFELVYKATENYPNIKASDVEFKLPQPNYTAHTLAQISDLYENHQFCLIMGEDNLKSFHRWKNFETILEHHELYVYPRISRGKLDAQFDQHSKIHKIAAPVIEISSTMIREGIRKGKNVRPMLPKEVWNYIDEMNFYRK
jgi:nicotinate-nucleotide adenylyltransferase